MTQHPDLFADLAAPFEPHELKTLEKGGKLIPYVTARVVMNRLDAVLGPENWTEHYCPQEHSVLCVLTITLPGGAALSKSDAGGYAGLADQGDDDKSGVSDAFKRAAVKFGVGRYLYRDGVPAFVAERYPALRESGPALRESDPAPGAGADRRNKPRREWAGADSPANAPAPKTGRGLYRWAKDADPDEGLIKYLSGWGRDRGYAPKMIDWSPSQAREAHAEGLRVLQGGSVAS